MTIRPTLVPHAAASGQGGLIAIALTILIALVIAGSGLTGLTSQNAMRSVSTKESLQTYYVAQAGIQEALASRMLPRSNYLNFVNSGASAIVSNSGVVYQDPANKKDIVGEYRYTVIGGDSARQNSGGNYYANNDINSQNIPRLVANTTLPESNPFIIISQGTICRPLSNRAVAAINQINIALTPTCKSGYVTDSLTLVSQVNLNRESPTTVPLMDRANQIRVFKDDTRIKMPAGASVPDGATNVWENPGNEITFNRVWNQGQVVLKRVVFYDFADNTIYANVAVTGASTTVPTPIPTKAAIRLYFDTPFDYRSISPTMERQLADCKGAGANNCRIRLMQGTNPAGNGGVVYSGNTMIPLFPGSTQVILLAPLTGQINGGGVRHAIKVDASRMLTFNGRPGALNYTVNFTTQ